jgi:hypothetical protein
MVRIAEKSAVSQVAEADPNGLGRCYRLGVKAAETPGLPAGGLAFQIKMD